MRLHDGFADRQAHAAALRFRGEECIEDLIGLARWQSWTRIVYRDLDLAVLPQPRSDREHAAGVAHGLDAIQHQVHEHLLDLHAVSNDDGEAVSEIRTDRNRVPGSLRAQQPDHLGDHVVYRQRLAFGRLFLIERALAVDDLRRQLAHFDDCRRPLTSLRQVRRIALKPLQRQAGVHDRGGDGLIQLV